MEAMVMYTTDFKRENKGPSAELFVRLHRSQRIISSTLGEILYSLVSWCLSTSRSDVHVNW